MFTHKSESIRYVACSQLYSRLKDFSRPQAVTYTVGGDMISETVQDRDVVTTHRPPIGDTYRITPFPMILIDLRGNSPVATCKPFQMQYFVRRAAVDKSSTDISGRAVPLRQLRFLSVMA